MPGRSVPRRLRDFLAPFPEDIRDVALALRARVLAFVTDAHEVVWDATNAVSLVYTPSDNWQDGIVHIATYAKRVNLGFNDGASSPDPLGILIGTGTRIRHVTFRSVADLNADWIEDYLDVALTQAGLDTSMGDGGTSVRVSKGSKRRPG